MAATTTRSRWIALQGAANVRDLGGLPLRGGGATAPGVLLRADNLQGLTARDVRRLVGDLGVRVVVDLRSEVEVELEGPGPLVGEERVEIRHRSLLPEVGARTDLAVDGALPWQGRRLDNDPDEPFVVQAYLRYLSDRADSVVGALHDVAYATGGVVVHCAAGKDRTGMLCAFALETIGVERAAVIADYVATGERLEALLARLRASPTYAADLEGRPTESHRPHAETMRRVLELVDERHGGVEGWLAAHGFDAADAGALRERLADGAPRR
ncbi:MAG: tyrosine-protein phosphatase [Solirubrobacteraceae bacterium]